MHNSFYKIENVFSDTLLVSFSGMAKLFGGIQKFEFVNFLNNNFKDISKHFYIDDHCEIYHKGISGISNNIDETVAYLQNEIKNYKNVIFFGNSGGGYAAILFGSLLKINTVIAFVPPTILRRTNIIDEKYRDISKYINDVTTYCIYGDESIINENNCHHISHCERINNKPNVTLIKKPILNLKNMRDSGELFIIFNNYINKTDNYINKTDN